MNDAAVAFALLAVAVLGWAYAFSQAFENRRLRLSASRDESIIAGLRTQIKAFDHDGNGKIGGSRSR
jgi:hypothetical protein